MRKFYLILLSLCAVCSFGQNQINGYTYWYNNDYASRTIQTIVPHQQAHLSFLAETSGLSEGLNIFHFQAFDINGIYSSPVSKFFYKTKGAPSDTNRIAAYRYWFNADVAHIDTVYITASKQADILAEIDANALNDGLNSIHIQVMDQQEIWSSVLSQYFLKSNTHYINAYQYWFNNDIASAVTLDVFPSKIVLINDAIDATALNEGMNILHLRFRDEQNLWSSTISQFFFKTETSGSDTAKICSYQYWFDNDFASAVTENIAPVTKAHISAAIPSDMLFNGLHVLNIRFKQENGLWTSPLSSYFFKMPESNASQNMITEYQYWFNSNFAQSVHHVLPQAMPQHELLLNIDMTQMPKGNYVLNLRTKDTLGMWSSVISDAFTKNPFPISSFTADITEFCDSGLVQFTNNSVDGDVYLWDFGDGSNSNDFAPQHFFTAPGQYNVSLTVTDIATQLDSTTSMMITIRPWYHFHDSVNICYGDTYVWRGQSYNQGGIYYDSLTTFYGCDSIFILNLFQQPHYQYISNDTICQGDTFFWRAVSYTQQGVYYDSLSTKYGCDSVYILQLTVNTTYEYTQSDVICQGDVFTWRGNNYTATGTYYDSLQTVHGCDSVYILNLTVNPVYEFSQSEAICNGETFTWRGNNYSNQGTYYDSLMTVHGCDSVYVLHLTVNQNFEFSENAAVCQGDTYTWRGQNYTIQGIYYDSLSSVHGCDSVYVLNLTVNPVFEFSQNEVICNGATFTWRGNSYSNQGTYFDSLTTVHGCDSVYVLNLTVNPTFEFSENAAVCQGDTYTWRGQNYTIQGIYYDSLSSVHGCDSVYVLHLTVNTVFEFTQNESICFGELFNWRGNNYSAAGTYYDSLTTQYGCDSLYVLHLTVNPTYTNTLYDTICDGSIYTWRGSTYTSAGTYYDSLQTNLGCDSIFVLQLHVYQVNVSVTQAAHILTANATGANYQWLNCDNNFAIIQGATAQTYTATVNGNYAVIVTQNNCTDTSSCYAVTGLYTDEYGNILSINLYPNPSDGNFNLSLSEQTHITLWDALAQKLYENRLPAGVHTLHLSHLTNGVYYIRAESDNVNEVLRVVVQR